MNQAPVSCVPVPKTSKARKILEEARENNNPELDLNDKGLSSLEELPGLFDMTNITRITLSHNHLKTIPPSLANLTNLEILTLANNAIEELPISLSSLPKLRILNLAMNRLYKLPKGFGAFPSLEVLDLTYNNLSYDSFPGNFFMMDGMWLASKLNSLERVIHILVFSDRFSLQLEYHRFETLRALYLGDNDLEYLPEEIKLLKNLQILVLRENDLIELPAELGELQRLRELHIQGNRLTLLPPSIGNLDLIGNKTLLRMDLNPWMPPIADQLQIGTSHVLSYLKTETYRLLYQRQIAMKVPPPPSLQDKSKKLSRQRA